MKNNKVKKNLSRKIFILLIIFWHLISQLSDPLASKANDQIKEDIHLLDRSISSSKIGLFAKTGYGEHYTLYPDGLEKEDAFIGGFKSTQLDPAEENIYFYDSSGKVISKININNGNVYKVLGKPKSTTNIGYTSPVNFDSASLGNLIDFSFDKFGNIFILDNYSSDPNNQNPRILKASLKESAIKEVLRINDLYKSAFKHGNSYDFSFRLDGISYGFDDLFYLYGKCNYARNGYGVYHWDSPGESVVILRFNPLTNSVEFFGSSPDLKKLGINPKVILNPNNSQYFILKGIAFDKSGILYLSTRDNINSSWRQELTKVGPGLNPDGTLVQEAFVSSLNNI